MVDNVVDNKSKRRTIPIRNRKGHLANDDGNP